MPNKAMAAAGGVGIGGAVATLIVALFWKSADANSVAAMTTLLNAAVGGFGAWLAKFEGAA